MCPPDWTAFGLSLQALAVVVIYFVMCRAPLKYILYGASWKSVLTSIIVSMYRYMVMMKVQVCPVSRSLTAPVSRGRYSARANTRTRADCIRSCRG